MNEEIKNKNFDINAKYEDMILNAESIVKHYLSTNDGSSEGPNYISLAYDVKNHLPTLIKEFQQLKSVNSFSKRTLYKINKDRLDANQRLLKENQQLKEDIKFCLHSIKQEMEMSTDSRTKKEMETCYEILKRWNE